MPLLRGLSLADLRQFCADRQLPDLTRLGVLSLSEAGSAEPVSVQEFGEAAQRLLKAAFAHRLLRVGADHTYEPVLCLRNYRYTPSTPTLDLDLN